VFQALEEEETPLPANPVNLVSPQNTRGAEEHADNSGAAEHADDTA